MSNNALKRLTFLEYNRAPQAIHNIFKTKDYFDDEFEGIVRTASYLLTQKLSEIDPSPTKKFTQWLLREYSKENFSIKRDFKLINKNLKIFNEFSRYLETKDIQQYSYQSFLEQCDHLNNLPVEARMSKRLFEKWHRKTLFSSKKTVEFYANQKTGNRAYRLDHFDAAKYYSRGTTWCIQEEDTFLGYKEDGNLYVILYEKNKYLFHITSTDIEFADSANTLINPDNLKNTLLTTKEDELATILSEVILWELLVRGHKINNYWNKPLILNTNEVELECFSRFMTTETKRHNLQYRMVDQLRFILQTFKDSSPVSIANFKPPMDEFQKLVFFNFLSYRFYYPGTIEEI